MSQICKRTVVEVSGSVTRFVTKDAPIVDGGAVEESGRCGLMKRDTSEVLPTPCAPRTTIFASRELGGWEVVMVLLEEGVKKGGVEGDTLVVEHVGNQLVVMAFCFLGRGVGGQREMFRVPAVSLPDA